MTSRGRLAGKTEGRARGLARRGRSADAESSGAHREVNRRIGWPGEDLVVAARERDPRAVGSDGLSGHLAVDEELDEAHPPAGIAGDRRAHLDRLMTRRARAREEKDA